MACLTAALAALLALLSFPTGQTFTLQRTYTGTDFFNNGFDLYQGYDPTSGFVEYVDLQTAVQYGLVDLNNVSSSGKARWGVDTQSNLDPNGNLGRKSLRLQSVDMYTHGLFILDVNHVPSTSCGTWPAFWSVGADHWPDSGEIDILENVNNVPGNLMSLHTAPDPNCTVAGTGQTGTLLTNDCAYGNSYTGCAVTAHEPTVSGSGLNSVGGGVYAMLWTSEGIQMWTFPRNALPASLSDSTKVPILSEFGMPRANFQGSCDFDSHFRNHQIIFNTDFCGSNAGMNFELNGCPMVPGKSPWESCNIYVANNPQAFTESYWEINSFKVYQVVAGPVSSPPTSVLPIASTSSISTLSSFANGRPTTPTSPIALPSTTVVQGRDLTSANGATWPASWTAPAPFPTTVLPRDLQPDLDTTPDPQAVRTKHSRPPIPLCPHDFAYDAVLPHPQTAHTERTQKCLKTRDVAEPLPTAVPQAAHTERTGKSLLAPTRTRKTLPSPDLETSKTRLVFDRDMPTTTHGPHIEQSEASLFQPTPHTAISTNNVVIPDISTYQTLTSWSEYSYRPKATVNATSLTYTGDANPVITVVPAAAVEGGGGTIRHGGIKSGYVYPLVLLIVVLAGAFLL